MDQLFTSIVNEPYNYSSHQQSPYQQSPYQQSPYQQSPYNYSSQQQSPYQQSPYNYSSHQQSPYQQSLYQQSPYNYSSQQQSPYNYSSQQQSPYQQSPYQQSPYQQSSIMKLVDENNDNIDNNYVSIIEALSDEVLSDEALSKFYDDDDEYTDKLGVLKYSNSIDNTNTIKDDIIEDYIIGDDIIGDDIIENDNINTYTDYSITPNKNKRTTKKRQIKIQDYKKYMSEKQKQHRLQKYEQGKTEKPDDPFEQELFKKRKCFNSSMKTIRKQIISNPDNENLKNKLVTVSNQAIIHSKIRDKYNKSKKTIKDTNDKHKLQEPFILELYNKNLLSQEYLDKNRQYLEHINNI